MLQDLPTPVIATRDPYKPVSMNGVTGNTAQQQQQHPHPETIGNMESVPGPPPIPTLPRPSQIAIPISILMPMFTQQQQPFLQQLAPGPLLPTATAPTAVPVTAATACLLPPPPPLPPPLPLQPPLPQYSTPPPDQPTQNYCEYLYHVGFMQGRFSDITVSFPSLQQTFALHALILARSPKLTRCLLNSPSPVLELDLGVSLETVHMVIGHLYRPLTHQDVYFVVNENPSIAAEMLDATQELELDLLQHQLLTVIHKTMSQTSVMFWAGTLVNRQQQQKRGSWMDIVNHHIVHFLTRTLPVQLEAFSQQEQQQQKDTSSSKDKGDMFGFGSCSTAVQPQTENRPGMIELAHVYAGLPLVYLKRCLEQSDLTDMVQHYHFALQVIQCREQMGRSELMVVLRFQGDEQGSEISIVKKQALRTGHWKPQDPESVLG